MQGDLDPIFNQPGRPMLDPLSAPFFLLGLLELAWSCRRPAAVLIFLWLITPLVIGTMLTTNLPDTSRSVAAAPAMSLLVALGLETFLLALAAVPHVSLRHGGAKSGQSVPWWPIAWTALVAFVSLGMAILGVTSYTDYVTAPVHHDRFYSAAHTWSDFLASQGAIAVTVVAPYAYPVEFQRLYAPAALVCNGLWDTTWMPCPPARVIIFDNDPDQAQRYAASVGQVSHGVASQDGITRFWYVQGQALPDPARALGGLQKP